MQSLGEGSQSISGRRHSTRFSSTRSKTDELNQRILSHSPECRRRKIKCDEQAPQCGQCRKSNRHCHVQDSVFKPQRIPVKAKKRQGPSPRIRSLAFEANADAEVGDRALHRGDSDYYDDDINELGGANTPTLSSANKLESSGNNTSAEGGRIPTSTIQTSVRFTGQNAENDISTPSSTPIGPIDFGAAIEAESDIAFSPAATVSSNATISLFSDRHVDLFFLRHYSECIAPWMDLLYRYEVFSREVLTLARENPILRYAACAVAAKQLSQLRNPLSYNFRDSTQEHMANHIQNSQPGFSWYGSKYYEKAIQTLVQSFASEEGSAAHFSRINIRQTTTWLRDNLMLRAQGYDPIVRLLGTCILIQFEQLSASRDAWSSHLTGFSQLLELIDGGKILEDHSVFKQVYPWTKEIMEVKAGFWNFVVNDLEESFVSQTRTRIDTENLHLWRNMGLLIEDDGTLTLGSNTYSLSTTPEHARDKVLSYFLIRLMCKLIDFLAPLTPSQLTQAHSSSPSTTPNRESFLRIEHQFDAWFELISAAYHPDGEFAAYESDKDCSESNAVGLSLWFSNDLCATTMIYYHMARMLLLIYRPFDLLLHTLSGIGNSHVDMLGVLREMEPKLRFHATTVVSIVRGSSCDAVKLRAIQPLYVAGRCISETMERRRLIKILTNIQNVLGVATEYRVAALLEEWQMSFEDLGLVVSLA